MRPKHTGEFPIIGVKYLLPKTVRSPLRGHSAELQKSQLNKSLIDGLFNLLHAINVRRLLPPRKNVFESLP